MVFLYLTRMINPKDVASRGIRARSEFDESRFSWTVPSELPYFEGHFPAAPTLPGVAMVDLTLELIRRQPELARANLVKLRSAKFTAVISPGMELDITLTRDAISGANGEIAWRAEWRTLNKSEGTLVPAASFLLSVRG